MNRIASLIVSAACLLMAGCFGNSADSAASGVLTSNGMPVANALVRFHPMDNPDDADAIAQGTTGEDGKFELFRQEGKLAGAINGIHSVTVVEGAIPESIQSSDDPLAVQTFMLSLDHRPLPVVFQRHVDTPLKVDVQPGNSPYQLEIGNK